MRGLGHAYGLQAVLGGLDLDLAPGHVLALVGPSGCGKTSLLHLAAGLMPVQQGTLTSDFQRPAVVFQEPRLLPWLNVLDNIALGLKALGQPRRQRQAHAQALALALGLEVRVCQQYPAELSGGMQSRVALARALAVEPDLLLLDEPFSALDVGLKSHLHRLLLAHRQRLGAAVLMITHDLMEALRLADEVVVMAASPGRVVHRERLADMAAPRGDAWVHHETARLLGLAPVRGAFGLAGEEAAASLAMAGTPQTPRTRREGLSC